MTFCFKKSVGFMSLTPKAYFMSLPSVYYTTAAAGFSKNIASP